MNEEFLANLWPAVASECHEHFEELESLLAGAGADSDKEVVVCLFRAFHSLKSLSGAVEMWGAQRVAHRCEDLLGLVRDDGLTFEVALVDLLLEAFDALKHSVEQGIETKSDIPVPDKLLNDLQAAFDRYKAELAADDDGNQVAVGDPSVLPSHEKQIDLHDDPQLLELYMQLAEDEVAIIAKAAVVEGALDEETLEEARRSADALAHGAQYLDFVLIEDTARALLDELPQDSGQPIADRDRFIDTLIELGLQYGHMEKEAEALCGRQKLFDALSSTLDDRIAPIWVALKATLSMWEDNADEPNPDEVEDWAFSAGKLIEYLTFAGQDRIVDMLMLARDAIGRLRTKQVSFNVELVKHVHEGVDIAEQICVHSKDFSPSEILHIESRIQDASRQTTEIEDSGEESDDDGKRKPVRGLQERITGLLGQIDIRPELVEILTNDHVTMLEDAIESGTNAYELLADTGSTKDTITDLLAWMKQHTTMVTNRTVFLDDQTWLEFLFISTSTLLEIEDVLKKYDPAGTAYQAHICRVKREESGAAAQKAEASKTASGAASKSNVIRVESAAVDRFMNQIGEMVMARNNLLHAIEDDAARGAVAAMSQVAQELVDKGEEDLARKASDAAHAVLDQMRRLGESEQRLNSSLGRLQDDVMDLRVVPIGMIFKRFPRVVRNIAQSQNKQIRVDIFGEEVRIDKGMVDILVDPIGHLVRNSVDHGMERSAERQQSGKAPQGTIKLMAQQRGNQIIVKVSDDGRGMDVTRIGEKAIEAGLATAGQVSQMSAAEIREFIFQPGFSTRDEVSDLSGRGVGLDVVYFAMQRLGGRVSVDSTVGVGSEFTLELPLSVAIQQTLLVKLGAELMAIPDRYIEEVIEVPLSAIQMVRGEPAILSRGAFLPIFSLDVLLGTNRAGGSLSGGDDSANAAAMTVLILRSGGNRIGVIPDAVHSRRELFVEDLNPQVIALPGIGGASLMGDGRVVLILDGEDLFSLAARGMRQGGGSLHQASQRLAENEGLPAGMMLS